MTLPALKEWDAQCQALASGQVAVILRKGGIMEARGDFEAEHRAFLLYPTFLHQNPAELRSEFKALLRPDPAPGHIHCLPVPRSWTFTRSSRWSRCWRWRICRR